MTETMGASVQLSSHSAAFEAPDHIGMTPRLSLRNITKRYPGITANDHVSLDIAPGEVLAILGENGAGKSTLMKIIYGAARPDEGDISFDGHTALKPRHRRVNSASQWCTSISRFSIRFRLRKM